MQVFRNCLRFANPRLMPKIDDAMAAPPCVTYKVDDACYFCSFVVCSFVRKTWQILILPRLGPGRTAVRLGTGGAPALAKLKFEKFSVSESCFSSISVDFGGARRLLTSESDSLTNFASDTQLLRSVRLLELSFVVRSFVQKTWQN